MVRHRSRRAQTRSLWPVVNGHVRRVNEPKNEPTGWTAAGRSTRFRGLRRAVRHRPGVSRAWAGRRFAVAGEQLRTGVNETESEPTGWAVDGEMACLPSVPGVRRGDLVGSESGPVPAGRGGSRPARARSCWSAWLTMPGRTAPGHSRRPPRSSATPACPSARCARGWAGWTPRAS